jgi:hypothetical protein
LPNNCANNAPLPQRPQIIKWQGAALQALPIHRATTAQMRAGHMRMEGSQIRPMAWLLPPRSAVPQCSVGSRTCACTWEVSGPARCSSASLSWYTRRSATQNLSRPQLLVRHLRSAAQRTSNWAVVRLHASMHQLCRPDAVWCCRRWGRCSRILPQKH